MDLHREILHILCERPDAPVDYVAIFMFLNTVAGGHYQERATEDELRQALHRLLHDGHVQARNPDGELVLQPVPGVTFCYYAVTAAGRAAALA